MVAASPTYDLVLLLDPQAEDAARAKIVADAQAAIQSQGELLRHDEWGTRTLAYPIKRKTVAEYHMLQFHAGSADLLRQLDRSLRLADEAIRHRIIKLASGVGEPPDMRSSSDPLRAGATPAPTASPAAAAPPPAPPAPAEPAPVEPAPAELAPAAEAAAAEAGASPPQSREPEAESAPAADQPPADTAEPPAGESVE